MRLFTLINLKSCHFVAEIKGLGYNLKVYLMTSKKVCGPPLSISLSVLPFQIRIRNCMENEKNLNFLAF